MELRAAGQGPGAWATSYPPFSGEAFTMSILSRLLPGLHRADPKAAMTPLYDAIVARGRQPHWFATGHVPDTLDGRFDMIAAILCLVLLRLEGGPARQESVWLTELFIDDMDGQLRQIGIGDMIVGKHIGKMMSALGGRLTAYRSALRADAPPADLEGALSRNLYRGDAPDASALAYVSERVRICRDRLAATEESIILAGQLPL